MQPASGSRFRKALDAVHRLFDPNQADKSDRYSLKYPPESSAGEHADLTAFTHLEAPPDTSLERMKVRASLATDRISQMLGQIQTDLSDDVDLNLGRLKDGLNAETSVDVIVRPFTLPSTPPLKGYVIYLDGVANGQVVEEAILEPLLTLGHVTPDVDILQTVETTLVSNRQTQRVMQLSTIMEGVVSGQCALLLEGAPGALLLEARNWPGRSVEKPLTESVVRGPQEAFTETIRTNTALLRRRLMTPDLIFEPAQVGRRSRTYVYLSYLKGLANPDLLNEIRRRVAALDVDTITDSGMLSQLIEESPKSLFPTIGYTERPDRAASAISEGRVAILVDGSPFVLLGPWLFSDYFSNPEDYYTKWPFGTFLRVVRLLGAMITLLGPAIYIAIANYHHEMIPSSLLLAIAASREAVPFPAPLEVLMMEVAFEIIREGSLRIPSMLGQTVGIVGALILGQAAVQASIVSPILVIVVALTALGSFTIPNYDMSLVIRLLRFVFIILGTTFGLYGIAVGLLVISAHAASLRSFGVPYLAPSGPRIPGSTDVMLRGPLRGMEKRPQMVRPQDGRRQAKTISPGNPGQSS